MSDWKRRTEMRTPFDGRNVFFHLFVSFGFGYVCGEGAVLNYFRLTFLFSAGQSNFSFSLFSRNNLLCGRDGLVGWSSFRTEEDRC